MIVQDCYEHFTDIDPHHIKPPNWLYSPILGKGIEIGQDMWDLLYSLAYTRAQIKYYHDHILHPAGHPGDVYSAGTYEILLRREAGLKTTLQQFANAYCIYYKGYSLN